MEKHLTYLLVLCRAPNWPCDLEEAREPIQPPDIPLYPEELAEMIPQVLRLQVQFPIRTSHPDSPRQPITANLLHPPSLPGGLDSLPAVALAQSQFRCKAPLHPAGRSDLFLCWTPMAFISPLA
ncbi:hypothetical protein P7K49_030108 [Saguinus oedipus]|uniref:Uncharacterized protein n=1 Tax=Saguinus oedipus TaxID=9490 RepID=A0ABQ9U191_SAGOE|nr:hypothetical protein P7K49_030108 [Saguinus oedipus]